MSFAPSSLVATRGREWVVLPDSDDELLVLRPLGGADSEIAGVLTELEEVGPRLRAPRPERSRRRRVGPSAARRAPPRLARGRRAVPQRSAASPSSHARTSSCRC